MIKIIQSWTVPYLCPGDGVLQSRELGDQFGRLVLLTYRSILQFKIVGHKRSERVLLTYRSILQFSKYWTQRSEEVLNLNLGWEGVAVETEVANPQFGAEVDLNKS